MDWKSFDSKVKELAATERDTKIELGDLLNEGEDSFGEKYAQVLVYFPEYKYHVVANWKSVCKAVSKQVRPKDVSMTQMETVRTLPNHIQKEVLEKAVDMGWGKNEINTYLVEQKLKLTPELNAEKFIGEAICKLNKALPISEGKTHESVVMALSVLEDISK